MLRSHILFRNQPNSGSGRELPKHHSFMQVVPLRGSALFVEVNGDTYLLQTRVVHNNKRIEEQDLIRVATDVKKAVHCKHIGYGSCHVMRKSVALLKNDGTIVIMSNERIHENVTKSFLAMKQFWTDVALGKNFGVLLNSIGRIYSFGSNTAECLGRESHLSNGYLWSEIKAIDVPNQSFISVAASGYHAAAVSDTNELWTWGENKQLQSGPRYMHCISKPTKVQNIPPVTHAACANTFTVALTTLHEVLLFGTFGDIRVSVDEVKLILLPNGDRPVGIWPVLNQLLVRGSSGRLYVLNSKLSFDAIGALQSGDKVTVSAFCSNPTTFMLENLGHSEPFDNLRQYAKALEMAYRYPGYSDAEIEFPQAKRANGAIHAKSLFLSRYNPFAQIVNQATDDSNSITVSVSGFKTLTAQDVHSLGLFLHTGTLDTCQVNLLKHFAKEYSMDDLASTINHNSESVLSDTHDLILPDCIANLREHLHKEFIKLNETEDIIQNEKIVSFVAQGTVVKCHRCILAQSDYFTSLVNHEWEESQGECIEIVDKSFACFKIILENLYTHRPPSTLTSENLVEVLFAAHEMQISNLYHYCDHLLMRELDVENVEAVLELGNRLQRPTIVNGCLLFISSKGDVDSLHLKPETMNSLITFQCL